MRLTYILSEKSPSCSIENIITLLSQTTSYLLPEQVHPSGCATARPGPYCILHQRLQQQQLPRHSQGPAGAVEGSLLPNVWLAGLENLRSGDHAEVGAARGEALKSLTIKNNLCKVTPCQYKPFPVSLPQIYAHVRPNSLKYAA